MSTSWSSGAGTPGAAAANRHAEGGDEFVRQLQPHTAVVLAVARRLAPDVAEDVVQETFVAAWRYRAGYRPEKGPLRACSSPSPCGRRTGRRPADCRRGLLLVRAGREEPAPPARTGDDEELEAAVAALSRRQREVVDLHYFADLTLAEVATALGVSEGTVKSTLSDARRNLRRLLGGDHDGPGRPTARRRPALASGAAIPIGEPARGRDGEGRSRG